MSSRGGATPTIQAGLVAEAMAYVHGALGVHGGDESVLLCCLGVGARSAGWGGVVREGG